MGRKDDPFQAGNPNRNPAAKSTAPAKTKTVKSRTVGSGNKSGSFVGDPKKIHIHIVGQNTHLKVEGKSHVFDPTDNGSVAKVKKTLVDSKKTTVSGYTDCLAWLEQPANKRI